MKCLKIVVVAALVLVSYFSAPSVFAQENKPTPYRLADFEITYIGKMTITKTHAQTADYQKEYPEDSSLSEPIQITRHFVLHVYTFTKQASAALRVRLQKQGTLADFSMKYFQLSWDNEDLPFFVSDVFEGILWNSEFRILNLLNETSHEWGGELRFEEKDKRIYGWAVEVHGGSLDIYNFDLNVERIIHGPQVATCGGIVKDTEGIYIARRGSPLYFLYENDLSDPYYKLILKDTKTEKELHKAAVRDVYQLLSKKIQRYCFIGELKAPTEPKRPADRPHGILLIDEFWKRDKIPE